jgi:hypothetical protein
VSPQWSDLVATTDVPRREFCATVLDSFYVKPGVDCSHHFTQDPLIKQRSTATSIKRQQQHPKLWLPKSSLEQVPDDARHLEA